MIVTFTKFYSPSILTLILSLWSIGLSDIAKTDKSVFSFVQILFFLLFLSILLSLFLSIFVDYKIDWKYKSFLFYLTLIVSYLSMFIWGVTVDTMFQLLTM